MSLGAGVAEGGGSNGAAGGAGGEGGSGAGAQGAAASGNPAGGGSGASGGGNPAAGGSSGASDPKLGTGTAGASSWRDSLPAELKDDPTLNKYSDLPNLAKAHIELQKKIGEKGIFKPKPGASPEEIKAFREAMGIPTEVDKYDLGKFEGVNVEQSIVDWAKKMGTDLGLEPTAMNKMITEYMKLDATSQAFKAQQTKDAVKKGMEGLATEWGDAFKQNIQRANVAAEKAPNGAEFIKELKAAGADNNPAVLKYLNWVASLLGEDKLREGGASSGARSPQELDAQISQVQARLFSLKPTDGAYLSVKNEFESLWKQKTRGK